VQFYLWVALDRPGLAAVAAHTLGATFGADLHPAAQLRVSGTWRPVDLFPAGPPLPVLRSIGLVSADRRGRLVSDRALGALAEDPSGSAARGLPLYAGEAAAPRLGQRRGGLRSLGWRDQPPLACAGLFRGGGCAWSLALTPRIQLARFDGQVVVRGRPGAFPEGDRAGVLIEGLSRLIGARLMLDGPERLTLPDALGWMVEEGEDHLIT